MRKGFTLVELLIILVIIAILMGASFYWIYQWLFARKIEGDVNKIYTALTSAQLTARREKITVTVSFLNSTALQINASGKVSYVTLLTPFNMTESQISINEIGLFNPPRPIDIYSQFYGKTTLNCVRVYITKVCEGSWDGSKCVCRF
jgi:prepilin-type N-terminal cleavage/methylation domain-containing protein